MIFKSALVTGLMFALTACAQEKPAHYFTNGAGKISGYEYISTADPLTWGGDIHLYALDAHGNRRSSDSYVIGHSQNNHSQWSELDLCGDEKLFGTSKQGCDIVKRGEIDSGWWYYTCDGVVCEGEPRSINIITLQPIIDRLNAAYNDKGNW
jgi:hypothetical protein